MSRFPQFDPARAVGVILGASAWPDMRTLRTADNGETFVVVAADLERDDRADVAENGVGGGLVQLCLGKEVRNQ